MKKKAKMTKSSLISIVLSIMTVLATMFDLIAFATQAWASWTDKITDRSVYIGLWYSVVCDGWSWYCGSISHHDEHVNNLAKNHTQKEVQYALRVGSQVIVTFALFFSIFGCAFTVLMVRSAKNKRQFHLGSMLCLFLSGALMLTVVGNWTGEISAHIRYKNDASKNVYHFPWSLLLAGLGGILSVVAGGIELIILCIELKPKSRQEPRMQDASYDQTTTQQTNMYTPSENNALNGSGKEKAKSEYIGLDLRKPELLNNCNDLYKENNEKCEV